MDFSYSSLKLNTKDDFENVLLRIISPTFDYLSEDKALMYLPDHFSATYSDEVSYLESFARVLWGLGPYGRTNQDSPVLDSFRQGIINGTDPSGREYWGGLEDTDQRAAEMVPVALFIYFNREGFWDRLDASHKKNIERWLLQINGRKLRNNNWQCFRILVNSVLKNLGAEYDSRAMADSFKKIESYYRGDGWYSDGKTDRMDYYVSFSIHYYLLIYAGINGADDAERSKIIRNRAGEFAKDYIYWFSSDGSSIPFGRSLIYRSAQVAFWSAAVFAGVEIFPLEVVKGIICRNLRWWLEKPIFSEPGTLNLGYAYHNPIMTEDYNSTGSPYWALKPFLILLLDADHEFWKAEEVPLPELSRKTNQRHPKMIICRDKKGSHVTSFVNGQSCNRTQANSVAKYEKFVYSNVFGFNVSRSNDTRHKGTFDSTLAVSRDGRSFRNRQDAECCSGESPVQYSVWEPFPDVRIGTYVIPGVPWHIRVHFVSTGGDITLIEGGFPIGSIPGTDGKEDCEPVIYRDKGIGLSAEDIHTGIVSLAGNGRPEVTVPSPYTNVINKRTRIPVLSWNLNKGEYRIVTAILGDKDGNRSSLSFWDGLPEVSVRDSGLFINGERVADIPEGDGPYRTPSRPGSALVSKAADRLIRLLQRFR